MKYSTRIIHKLKLYIYILFNKVELMYFQFTFDFCTRNTTPDPKAVSPQVKSVPRTLWITGDAPLIMLVLTAHLKNKYVHCGYY